MIIREADTIMFAWHGESKSHADEIRSYIAEELPVREDSIFDLLHIFDLDEASGMVIIRYDPENVTDEDIEHAEAWKAQFPSNDVEYFPASAVMSIIRMHKDDIPGQGYNVMPTVH